MLNFLSCTGNVSPAAAAASINRELLAYDGLSRGNGGVLIFDFFDARLGEKVYSANTAYLDGSRPAAVCTAPYAVDDRTPTSRYLSAASELILGRARKKR